MQYHWPDAYHHDDIHTLTYEKLNYELSKRFGDNWRTDDIILTGGFPCQPYSAAGKRLGKEDSRHLWPEMLRVIREVQPTWVVGENVFGLINWSGGLVFHEVQADLEAEGYEVQSYVLPAAGVGSVHRRDRVWFVAHTNNPGTGIGLRDERERKTEDNGWEEQSFSQHRSDGKYGDAADTTNKGREVWQQNGGWQNETENITRMDIWSERLCNNGIAPDPERLRLELSQDTRKMGDRQGEMGREGGEFTNAIEANGKVTNAADSDRNGFNECDCEDEEQSSQGRFNAFGDIEQSNGNGDAADTGNERLQGGEIFGGIGSIGQNGNKFTSGCIRPDWEEFPTQSPICGKYDGVSDWMVRHIKPEIYATITERYTDQELQEVWDILQSEEIREYLGGLYKIHEPTILLKVLQLCSPSNTDEKGTSAFSEETSEALLRKLREYGTFANTPQGRELEKQFKEQFADTMPYLSHEIALVAMEVERRTVSAWSKWRNESIKAYGNAVVPQIPYAIFKTIEEYENTQKNL